MPQSTNHIFAEAVDWAEQSKRYVELLNCYKNASSSTVIREEAYVEHNDVEYICRKNDKRKQQLVQYRRHEENQQRGLAHEEVEPQQVVDPDQFNAMKTQQLCLLIVICFLILLIVLRFWG